MLPLLLSAILYFSDIGEQIWQNECSKDKEKLIFWNPHEPFPSLGIGHFIWLPKDSQVPFEQTFPSLILFLKKEGLSPPLLDRGRLPLADTSRLSERKGELQGQRAPGVT